ncbi:hypothetical protein DY000_02050488 [Brassica cretica]|uniref:Uncharacterized protein n=1 Tax=Brassica cretica TaxID=69181 RepID=A0ABQ7EXL4_BRACR|nr:hypothetical protein DY000_02050488 [Brassica cretica]
MELSSVLDASTSQGSWVFGFPVPRRSLVFRLVIPAPLLVHLGSRLLPKSNQISVVLSVLWTSQMALLGTDKAVRDGFQSVGVALRASQYLPRRGLMSGLDLSLELWSHDEGCCGGGSCLEVGFLGSAKARVEVFVSRSGFQICGGVDRFEAAFFLARRRVVDFPSLPPVKLDLGPVGLRRRARRGERYCMVAVALALVRAAASVCLSAWASMTSHGLFRRRSGFVLPGSPLSVLLCPSAYGFSPLSVSSVNSSVLLRCCFAEEAIWSYHRFSMLERVGLSVFFGLARWHPKGSLECVAAESSWRLGSPSIGGGIGVPHGVPGDIWVHLELKGGD